MRSRTAQLAAATMVVAAALAIGVETLRPNKINKAYAFRARIQANTALDLDPKAAVPLSQAQPEDFDVTWDSTNGGTLRIMANSSLRLLACRYIKPDWDDVVSWAHESLEELKNSATTAVVPTEETPFAAVLTNEGNIAVIRAAGPDEEGAWLSWRVEKAVGPGYGPVQTATLCAIDEEGSTPQRCAIDFDTGSVIEIPEAVLRLPADGLLAWLEQTGVDAIARMSEEGNGLVGVGLIFWTWMASEWAETGPVEVREEMNRATEQPRSPLFFREGQYQPVFPFRTREGAIGMLQMLAVDASKRTVQLRYRMLLEEGGNPVPDADAESERLAESVKRLMRFGLMAWKYAEEHDWRYPDTIDELEDYAPRFEQDFQWILDNVGYVGAGRTGHDPGSTLIAYDKTLLALSKGTNAVFRDGHAEFIEPTRLSEYGLAAPAKE